jgi:hypothetical protein
MEDEQQYIDNYIKTFSSEEKTTFDIARSYLKTSFSIEKSIGFLDYLKSIKPNEKN